MRESLRAFRLMLSISLAADARRSVGTLITAVGSMALMPARSIGLRLLTDGIVNSGLQTALLGIGLIVGLTAISRFMFWASFNLRMRMRENTQVYLDALIMDLTAGIPGLEHHERPDYLDNVEVVRSERWMLANPFNPISWTVGSVFQVISVFVLLGSVHPLLMLLPLTGVPAVLLGWRWWYRMVILRETQAEPMRMLRHLQKLTTDAAAAKEIRIYGLSGVLIDRRRAVFSALERVRLGIGVQMGALSAVAWVFFALCFLGALLFTIDLSSRGGTTVGSVVLVLGLATQINRQLGELVANVSWMARTIRAMRRLVWLSDYAQASRTDLAPTTPRPVPDRLSGGITFEDVTFRYPGTERPVLSGVDLHLPAGSTVAIVGDNGAGKTTLVKLLSRMYEPSGGAIRVDGIDLRDLPVEEWRTRLAAGFQDFARLQLLARESIGLGDASRLERDEVIFSAVDRAAAGDLWQVLPDGLQTQLGRSFEGGQELSIGQWQKVALGRAMMRERILLLLLDEPTASLDAPTERALFEHFASAAREYAAASGAITVLVSHRFSTVRMADLIVVIADGRIVERGSHQELVQRGGLYAELYGLQASAYR
jgi:ATP-binding cassette, subfamily B, bacterial